MSSRILLIEDEPALVLTLSDLLQVAGHEVESALDGTTGLARALAEPFDLVILDIMLPGKSGFDVCRQLRQQGRDIAVMILTARSQLVDRVVGLKLGADDYVTKPYEPAELLARVEALLRRVHRGSLAPLARFEFGGTLVDFDSGEAQRNGHAVSLTSKELDLLRYLVERRGNAVSREELLENVWLYQAGVSSRTVDVHVAWLRQKLEPNPQYPRHIQTVRGVGYRFAR